jgi:hypothetical protein
LSRCGLGARKSREGGRTSRKLRQAWHISCGAVKYRL